MVISFNSDFAMLKHVLAFDEVKTLCNIVRDLRLQFAGESLQSVHLGAGKQPCVFKLLNMVSYCVKVLINTGKRLINVELPLRMVSSQVASMKGDLVRAAFGLLHRMRPVSLARVHHNRQKRSAFKVQSLALKVRV